MIRTAAIVAQDKIILSAPKIATAREWLRRRGEAIGNAWDGTSGTRGSRLQPPG